MRTGVLIVGFGAMAVLAFLCVAAPVDVARAAAWPCTAVGCTAALILHLLNHLER